ncbi:ATP-binding protein [Lachnospiraceae bacterium SGI.240]
METATHDKEVTYNMPSSSEEGITPDSKVAPTPASKKKERRIYDISTKRGIKKQAREDIRILKFEKKQRKKEQAKALKVAKREKKQRLKAEKQKHKEKLHQDKLAQKEAKRLEKATKKDARSNKKQPDPSPSASSKKKKRKDMTLEDYLPIDKIANGIIYTTDHRYVKILEIEPINFLLRSAREQQGIIYSFISYLKISPVKLQIKMISKKADINKHLEQAALELSLETNPHCRELQKDYIQFVKKLSSREAVSRRFFLIFEYEPFNVNRKVEEKEILAALETAAQTAKTFLYQCGNQVVTHDNEDEFTTDVLYTLLNRTLCTEKPLQDRIADVLARYMKEGRQEELDHIRINEFIAPESVDFRHSNYVRINGIYHAYLLVPSDGYKQKVAPGWLSLLINAGEGIDIDFYLHKQPKDKIQQRLGQQIRINRSKIKDASDTNADFDDLDSAIRSGYFLKAGLANNEDFYYINLLITITASNLEELQWRIQEMKKLLISQDMDLHSCYFLQEQGFLSSLPLANLDKKLYELSKRNVLTTGAASCYPFTSYSICDDNGILFGVNKHNNSLVIADIFDSKQYKNSNICILGCSGAGKTFTMQTMALRMRRKGIQVFIIAPLKGHEFYRACKNVGGEFIQISPASQNCINVMEIRKVDNSVNELLDGPTLDASALASKIQRLHIFFSLLIPDMNHEEKQLLDETLIKTYARKGITHKNESLIDPDHPNQYKEMPILEDVYNILMESPDTKRLAHILNRLVHGSASSFNQKTNVDLTNKYTVLDISELTGSSDLPTVGMFVALDYVWDKAKENRTEEKAIFVDEVWQLIGASSNRLAAEFVLEIAKIIRAYSGAGIFATQDLNDFFALDDGKYGKGIINNCKTKIILNMEDEEAQRVKNILHLSETEVMNITHFQRGNGLISTNNNNITVEFKASTLEKELITTDRQELLEIIERQKHKEAKAG